MKISKFTWMPGLGFVLLFPGFFFYHALLAFGVITPILGGFFGPIAIAMFFPIIIKYLWLLQDGNVNINNYDILFFLLVSYGVFIAVFNYATSSYLVSDGDLLNWSISGFFFNFLLYLVARTINFRSGFFKKSCLFFLLVMIFVVFANIGNANIFYLAQDVAQDADVATYQGFGRSLVFVALLILAIEKSKINFYFIALLSSAALFFNGARSEFLAFLIATMAVMFYKFNISRIFVFVACLLLACILALQILPNDLIEGNRFFELFNISTSTSAQARFELTKEALRTIAANPLFGDYGAYARRNGGGIGEYAHNLLSAWVNLGFIGFAGWLGFLILLIKGFFEIPNSGNNRDFYALCVIFWAFTVFMMCFSKDYSFLAFGWSAGLLARFKSTLDYSYPIEK